MSDVLKWQNVPVSYISTATQPLKSLSDDKTCGLQYISKHPTMLASDSYILAFCQLSKGFSNPIEVHGA